MAKIIRTPTCAKGGITPDEKRRMDEHAKVWIANAVRTDTVDRPALMQAIKDLYRVSGKDEPIVVIVPSPRIMAFAGGFAAAIWHLRNGGAATAGATAGETDAATYVATRDATRAAIDEATDAATRAVTCAATYVATDAATYVATRAVTYAATVGETNVAIDAVTARATDEATRDDATYDATLVATRDATDAATIAATYAATSDATLFGRIATQILGQNNAVFGLQCAQHWYRMYQGGNMWSAWDCYLTAARDILGLRLPAHEKYKAWERCAKLGGFRIMHEKFCMVSDFPCKLERDAENRPHCANGPSHQWRDGWSLYYWHGVRVTQQIIEAPHTLTVAQIEGEINAEVRRVMIERYGAARYLADSGATVVHELPATHPIVGLRTARLLRKEVANDVPIVMIDLLNSSAEPDGTVKRYQVRIDPDAYDGKAATDCWAAAASTWRLRLPDGVLAFSDYRDYQPEYES